MNIEFHKDAATQIEQAIKSGAKDVRNFLNNLDFNKDVSRCTISSLSPGLSGAGVFKITRIRTSRNPRSTLLLKIAADSDLIAAELSNYKYIEQQWRETPKLLADNTNLLLYEFGGSLGIFKPLTLRDGYARSSPEALSVLMERLVKSLQFIHMIGHDTMSFVNQVKFKKPLDEQLKSFPFISKEKASKLIGLWNWLQENADQYPSISCIQGHGDLNSGNVLFEPGNNSSYPVFIDFASMMRLDQEPGKVLPFSDYAKIERDLKTRMFLKEAIEERLVLPDILSAIHDIDLGNEPSSEIPRKSVQRLAKTIRTLRRRSNGTIRQWRLKELITWLLL